MLRLTKLSECYLIGFRYSLFFSFDSDEEVLAKRSKDVDLAKKKKHKKHKKHKKSSKTEQRESGVIVGDREKPKKHKKHKRKSRRVSESSISSGAASPDEDVVMVVDEKPTLSSKFTEIMKSNGQVAAPKVFTKTRSTELSTNPTELVRQITDTLRVGVPIPSLEIVSSDAESDVAEVNDVESPDVAVIEEELNLEDLMKQKALLQACLGDILSESDTEEKAVENKRKPKATVKVSAVPATTTSDVILLDDSSGEVLEKGGGAAAIERKIQKKREEAQLLAKKQAAETRDRKREISRDNDPVGRDERDRSKQRRLNADRNEKDNRFKEDLRKEIDRDR